MNAIPLSQKQQHGCNLCGAVVVRELYTASDHLGKSDEPFSIVECSGCGVLRTLPEMSDEELDRFYPEDYWGECGGPSQGWIEKSQAEKVRFLETSVKGGGRILDIGSGAGYFLRALDANRWDRFGVELGKVAAAAANRVLGQDRVFTGTLIDAACAENFFDVVTFWSSLEHTNRPKANIIEARHIIKPGGTLILEVPNSESYQARFFGSDWSALDVPRHRYHFTTAILKNLLADAGFEVYRLTYYSRTHNSHALRQSLKARLLGKRPTLINKAIFCLAIPFIKPFDWLMTTIDEGATITLAARAI